MDEFDAIIAAEFGVTEGPSRAPRPTDPTPNEPASTKSQLDSPRGDVGATPDDFHLNLYDDDESYKEISTDTWAMGPLARWGVGAIMVGIVIAVLRLTMSGPGWLGWVTGALLMCGIGLCIAQATQGQRDDGDGSIV